VGRPVDLHAVAMLATTVGRRSTRSQSVNDVSDLSHCEFALGTMSLAAVATAVKCGVVEQRCRYTLRIVASVTAL